MCGYMLVHAGTHSHAAQVGRTCRVAQAQWASIKGVFFHMVYGLLHVDRVHL